MQLLFSRLCVFVNVVICVDYVEYDKVMFFIMGDVIYCDVEKLWGMFDVVDDMQWLNLWLVLWFGVEEEYVIYFVWLVYGLLVSMGCFMCEYFMYQQWDVGGGSGFRLIFFVLWVVGCVLGEGIWG